MIRFHPIALAALVAASLGLTACGGGDDGGDSAAADEASKELQQRGVSKQDADELAATAQKLKDQGFTEADAAKLKREVSDSQRRSTELQRELVDVTKAVQSKKLSEAEGTKKLAAIRTRIQQQALSTAEELEKVGALPASAKKQVEAARKQLQEAAGQK